MDNSTTSAPAITITKQLTPSVSVVTKVYGEALSTAVVEVHIKTIVAWVVQLMPTAPQAVLPQSLVYDGVTVEQGATFILTVPFGAQPGMVMFDGTIIDPPVPAQKFAMAIATWSLESA